MQTGSNHRQIFVSFVGCMVFLLGLFLGCEGQRHETPTKGYVTIASSESVEPLMTLEKEKFEGVYPQAHVNMLFMTGREAITRLFNDTIKTIVLARAMNDEEKEVAKRANLKVAEYKIAIDAIAVLVNNDNPITQLRTTQLDSIFIGIVKNWHEVGGKNAPIEMCLPDINAASYEVVGNKILHGGKFAAPAAIAKNSLEMLQFVATHPNAIGLIGLDRVGEKKDNVKVLDLGDPNAPDSLGIKGEYFPPLQAHVYRGYYPLTRPVYMYSRDDNYGPAAGFITFVCSPPGQQIVLNSGLVPATQPIRLVELTNKGVQP